MNNLVTCGTSRPIFNLQDYFLKLLVGSMSFRIGIFIGILLLLVSFCGAVFIISDWRRGAFRALQFEVSLILSDFIILTRNLGVQVFFAFFSVFLILT